MREEILKNLDDMLEVEEPLTEETELAEIEEWDSLASLSFIATAKKKYSKAVSGSEVKACVTVKDLIDLLV